MLKSRYLFAAAVASLVVAGCGGNRAQAGLPPAGYALVRVENNDISNMRIYVRQGPVGSRFRLGTAPGMQTSTFKIPQTMVNGVTELIFEITPQGGGRSQFSQRVTVASGEEIELRISP